jgi:hypothetical protein
VKLKTPVVQLLLVQVHLNNHMWMVLKLPGSPMAHFTEAEPLELHLPQHMKLPIQPVVVSYVLKI